MKGIIAVIVIMVLLIAGVYYIEGMGADENVPSGTWALTVTKVETNEVQQASFDLKEPSQIASFFGQGGIKLATITEFDIEVPFAEPDANYILEFQAITRTTLADETITSLATAVEISGYASDFRFYQNPEGDGLMLIDLNAASGVDTAFDFNLASGEYYNKVGGELILGSDLDGSTFTINIQSVAEGLPVYSLTATINLTLAEPDMIIEIIDVSVE